MNTFYITQQTSGDQHLISYHVVINTSLRPVSRSYIVMNIIWYSWRRAAFISDRCSTVNTRTGDMYRSCWHYTLHYIFVRRSNSWRLYADAANTRRCDCFAFYLIKTGFVIRLGASYSGIIINCFSLEFRHLFKRIRRCWVIRVNIIILFRPQY